MEKYPRVEFNTEYFAQNVRTVVDKCKSAGVQVTGVIKGATALPEVARIMAKQGCIRLASSRIGQLEKIKDIACEYNIPLELIRIPMLSEVPSVIALCDYSLNSEAAVIKALNDEAVRCGKIHKVILMADLGDLREGFWDKHELLEQAKLIENEYAGLELAGVGTNLGCYGSIDPTKEKLSELVEVAELVENTIGRRLEIISGGATSSYFRVLDGDMLERINDLRIGEAMLIPVNLEEIYGYDISDMQKDVFLLKAEVVEAKTKPSYPVGKLAVDAFGHVGHYEDKGMRSKVLVAVGRVDYGDFHEISPKLPGVEVLGASSDHTILDVTDSNAEIKVGDIMEFNLKYSSLIYATNCKDVEIVMK